MNSSIQTEIKREDKKKLKGFILILIASFFGGGFLGGAIAICDNIGIVDTVVKPVLEAFLRWSVYGNFAIMVITLVSVCMIYMNVKGMLKEWDQEDDIVFSKMNYRLSIGLLITTIAQILSFCFFSAGILEMERNADLYKNTMIPGAIFWIGFIGVLIVITISQQKIVNLTKVICPEKKGSIYDKDFQKKWLESCDEAEKAIVYESSYSAYKAVIKACMTLWIISVLGIMFFESGIYPTIVITVIWMCANVTYCVKSMRMEKKH